MGEFIQTNFLIKVNPSNYLKIKNKLPSNVNILAVSKGFKSQEIKTLQNIFLRIDQGAESLLSKKKINIKTNRFKTFYPSSSLNVIVNTLSICFICIAIYLRKLYGAL